MILPVLTVFAIAAVLDSIWAEYIAAIRDRVPFRAGVFGALTVGLGAFNLSLIVTDWRFLLPAMLGAFTGTYLSVKHRA